MTAFEAKAVVELDAELDEVADASRRLLGENGHGARAAEAPARSERVLRMKVGSSSSPTAAAIPPCAS